MGDVAIGQQRRMKDLGLLCCRRETNDSPQAKLIFTGTMRQSHPKSLRGDRGSSRRGRGDNRIGDFKILVEGCAGQALSLALEKG